MQDARASFPAYRFGPFRLNAAQGILERDGERVQLTPKAVDTLAFLVENSGRVVTKEELMRAVWPDVTVVESGLTRNISALRKALEDGSVEGSYIETIPKRGYRFVYAVTAEPESVTETAATSVAISSRPLAASRFPSRLVVALGVAIILGVGVYWIARAMR